MESVQRVIEILASETSRRLTYMPPQDFIALEKLSQHARKVLDRIENLIDSDEIIDGFGGSCNFGDDIDKNFSDVESEKSGQIAYEIVERIDDDVVRDVEENSL